MHYLAAVSSKISLRLLCSASILGKRHVIGRPRRWLLRRPFVGGDVVFEDAIVLSALIAAHQVQLSVCGRVPVLLFGRRTRGTLLHQPPTRRLGSDRRERDRDDGGARAAASTGSHPTGLLRSRPRQASCRSPS